MNNTFLKICVISIILISASIKKISRSLLNIWRLLYKVKNHLLPLISFHFKMPPLKQLVISIKCYVQHCKNCSKCKTDEQPPHHGLVPTVWADPCAMPGTDHLYLPLIGNLGEEEEENHCNDCSLDPQPPLSLVI